MLTFRNMESEGCRGIAESEAGQESLPLTERTYLWPLFIFIR